VGHSASWGWGVREGQHALELAAALPNLGAGNTDGVRTQQTVDYRGLPAPDIWGEQSHRQL
jgi:hypothetical protein